MVLGSKPKVYYVVELEVVKKKYVGVDERKRRGVVGKLTGSV
jgi:hypothetical protein